MKLGQYELALLDADRCAKLAPDFVKGHFRKGKALLELQLYTDAV